MDDDGQAIGYQILPRGTPVVTSDGVELGRVARVLDNAREHIFDGIVVQTANRQVFVDAPEVERITDRRVTLTITAAESEALQEYGAMQRAAKPTSRWKRWFGR